MATSVRSFSKINLGLGIGPVRGDGFHGLVTLYQTLDVHDLVTVTATRAAETRISLSTNHPRVPIDARNTVWKMVEKCLAKMGVGAEVAVHIEKNLPVQGGMGAGSANAAAALIGLERELGMALAEGERLALAAAVGSDVPLFLVGGAVLGTGRGEIVEGVADLPRTACVVAVPEVGVSTPTAFREWDRQYAGSGIRDEVGGGDGSVVGKDPTSDVKLSDMGHPDSSPDLLGGLTLPPVPDRLKELSLAYASAFGVPKGSSGQFEPGTSGIVSGQDSADAVLDPEKKQVNSDGDLEFDLDRGQMGLRNDLAENILLSLVRTGVENDFEEVVFPEYPSLREIKRLLMGIDSEAPALYAALSGSGSALFGLYRSVADAELAQQRVQQSGVTAFVTETLPRAEYWARMFAG